MFRGDAETLEVFLAHPGGPFFRKKDGGAWGIPKGLVEEGEDLEAAAVREFSEETGLYVTEPLIALGSIVQKAGKVVHAWAFRGTAPDGFVPASNTFEIEWPPRSGRRRSFPEIDRAEFFDLGTAHEKINAAQVAFLVRLVAKLDAWRV
jgi:predicted NUDIX family NTP pyrophosphohydrolase